MTQAEGSQIKRYLLSWLPVIFCVAFLARAGFVVLHQRPLLSDEREYTLLANNLLETHSYARNGVPTAYRPPGYPFFLAGIMFLFGSPDVVLRLAQAFLDSLTALFLFFLAKPYGERSAYLASLIWTFYPPAVLYAGLLLSETIYTFLIVLSAFILLRPGITSPGYLIGGIVLGFSTLVKPGTLVFVLLLVLFFWKRTRTPKWLASLTVGVLFVLSPWIVRNQVIFDRWIISSNVGLNLFIGSNPGTTGAYNSSFPPEILSAANDELTLNDVAQRLALDHLRDHPTKTFLNGLKKIAVFWGMEGELLVSSFHPDPSFSSTRFSTKYAQLPLLPLLVVNLSSVGLVLLGFACIFSSEQDLFSAFFSIFLASLLIVHFIFFGGSRFHFPLMPFFAVFASLVLSARTQPITALPPLRRTLLFLVSFGLTTLWLAEVVYVFDQ